MNRLPSHHALDYLVKSTFYKQTQFIIPLHNVVVVGLMGDADNQEFECN